MIVKHAWVDDLYLSANHTHNSQISMCEKYLSTSHEDVWIFQFWVDDIVENVKYVGSLTLIC